MERFTLSECLLVLLSVISVPGAADHGFPHMYLGYISPTQFIKGFSENAEHYIYPSFRVKRSVMHSDYQPMPYKYHLDHQPMSNEYHPHNKPMPYDNGYGFGYNPMLYPYKMSKFPFKFPAMPRFSPMRFDPEAFFQNMAMKYPLTSFNKMMHPVKPEKPVVSNAFGDDFMKMMGFSIKNNGYSAPTYKTPILHFTTPSYNRFDPDDMNVHSPSDKFNTDNMDSYGKQNYNFDQMNYPSDSKMNNYNNMNYPSDYNMNNYDKTNYPSEHNMNSYDKINYQSDYNMNNYDKMNYPSDPNMNIYDKINYPSDPNMNSYDKMNYQSNPKMNNFDVTYSSSYSMDMDYKDGKGHMVTKDSSYMNDNGKIKMNESPERHYRFTMKNGKH